MIEPTMRLGRAVFSVFAALLITSCGGGGGGSSNPDTAFTWLIPADEIFDGGPGQDGIPAIEEPYFETASTITSVAADTLVIVLRFGGEIKAYPHDIMNWHEIVNDGPNDSPFAMSYCPLTGSAVTWRGDPNVLRRTFGVSGLLYNSNLILYDRTTDSRWSQMLQKSVWGPRAGEESARIQVLEMPFSTLQQMYPSALVMTRQTGWDRDYDDYPYGLYLSHNFLLFPVSVEDHRLHLKTRVIGIQSDTGSRAYQLDGFGDTTQAINDQFEDQSIVVIGDTAQNFAAIYSRVLSDGTILNFGPIQSDLPNVMSDDEGNIWDIFGTAVSGPRAGEQMAMTRSYTALWFAWAAFFQDAEIYFN
ncbi:MAG: DUF3179 domain-containing protein [Woeseiaceae bacterium]